MSNGKEGLGSVEAKAAKIVQTQNAAAILAFLAVIGEESPLGTAIKAAVQAKAAKV